MSSCKKRGQEKNRRNVLRPYTHSYQRKVMRFSSSHQIYSQRSWNLGGWSYSSFIPPIFSLFSCWPRFYFSLPFVTFNESLTNNWVAKNPFSRTKDQTLPDSILFYSNQLFFAIFLSDQSFLLA